MIKLHTININTISDLLLLLFELSLFIQKIDVTIT
jgi:hypothetical protein